MPRNRAIGFAMAAVTAASLAAFSTAAQADGMATGKMLAVGCFNCHGLNGASVGIVEDIYDISADKLVNKMNAFKSGEKASTIMQRFAKGYNDAEIKAIADYIQAANK